jgi:hypothetical protein
MFPKNVTSSFHKFPKNLPIAVHPGRFDGTFQMCHLGTFLVHRSQYISNVTAGNTAIVQFRELQGKPQTIHFGTLQKHSLGTFEMFLGFS